MESKEIPTRIHKIKFTSEDLVSPWFFFQKSYKSVVGHDHHVHSTVYLEGEEVSTNKYSMEYDYSGILTLRTRVSDGLDNVVHYNVYDTDTSIMLAEFTKFVGLAADEYSDGESFCNKVIIDSIVYFIQQGDTANNRVRKMHYAILSYLSE